MLSLTTTAVDLQLQQEGERTLAIVTYSDKLDDIIQHIELNGFRIIETKTCHLTVKEAKEFYTEHQKQTYYDKLVNWLSSFTVCVFILEKENAIQDWKDLMGPANYKKAKKANPNSIRALFGENISQNATHGSDSVINAKKEIEFMFRPFTTALSKKEGNVYSHECQNKLKNTLYHDESITLQDQVKDTTINKPLLVEEELIKMEEIIQNDTMNQQEAHTNSATQQEAHTNNAIQQEAYTDTTAQQETHTNSTDQQETHTDTAAQQETKPLLKDKKDKQQKAKSNENLMNDKPKKLLNKRNSLQHYPTRIKVPNNIHLTKTSSKESTTTLLPKKKKNESNHPKKEGTATTTRRPNNITTIVQQEEIITLQQQQTTTSSTVKRGISKPLPPPRLATTTTTSSLLKEQQVKKKRNNTKSFISRLTTPTVASSNKKVLTENDKLKIAKK
ncbi:uncharacterized protein BX663DRAFT_505250 [Cokeromyces recurvatus]|uniref:uncharacterized protein n=1 Tax=Cokeromyces recurvatus TaxID=90255 RepID=UPI002220B246|nr:uncharacterized protein BX663DRAFT_505250 [Cokeromyces recurvatus]KAI7903792.1 hypothetical protein BX663DRAFT_505250 [Cokeromyces recurvatus]